MGMLLLLIAIVVVLWLLFRNDGSDDDTAVIKKEEALEAEHHRAAMANRKRADAYRAKVRKAKQQKALARKRKALARNHQQQVAKLHALKRDFDADVERRLKPLAKHAKWRKHYPNYFYHGVDCTNDKYKEDMRTLVESIVHRRGLNAYEVLRTLHYWLMDFCDFNQHCKAVNNQFHTICRVPKEYTVL